MAGRGKSQKNQILIATAKSILEEIQPCSVRAVCYKLFTMGLIENMSKAETDKVSAQLTWARENGIIPWAHIVDETRSPESRQAWNNPDEIVNAAMKGYHRDYWQEQDHCVEVWAEKGTIRGTIWPIIEEYGVTLRVMHGFSSATAIYDAAQDSALKEKPLTVFYIGDWDPSGMKMSEADLPERMTRYGGKATIKRIALTYDDITYGELPSFEAETKAKDSNHKWFVENYGEQCYEVDALSPVMLRQRVEEAIRETLDLDRWNHAMKIEEAQKRSMMGFLNAWNNRGSISGLVGKYSDAAA